jgi:hypothetical protein
MQDLHIKLEDGYGDLIVREGQAAKLIEPKAYGYTGNLGTVATWLTTKADDVDTLRAVVIVNYDKAEIELDLNTGQENQRLESSVKGYMAPYPYLEDFRINTGRTWELKDLANVCKFNRRYFPNKEQNVLLVTALAQFKGTVTREIEKMSDDRGNHRRSDHKEVSTKLPEIFTLNMPLFKNEAPVDFDVEVLIEEKEGVVRAVLQSVSLLEKREAFVRERIDAEVAKFSATGITIIYQ